MKTRMRNMMLVTMLSILLIGLSGSRAYCTTVTWTGSGINDNWSNGSNWFDGAPPTDTDSVTFNANDSGNINIVDMAFTIAGLQYIGNSVHTTDLNGSSNLQINGPVSIGVGYSGSDSATLTWTNGGAITIGSPTVRQGLAIGHNLGITADTIAGSLRVEGTSVDVFAEGGLVIGGKLWGGPGRAEGDLILGENSKLNIDNSGWWMDIGANWEGEEGSESIGLLDTRLGEAELHTHTLSIGFASTWGQGKAEGTVILGSNDIIRADAVFVGGGTAQAKGLLEATEGDIDFRVRQLYVGDGGTGVLRWDQANPLYAEDILFGYGNGVGVLEVPESGTCRFGSEVEPVSLMMLGCGASYNGNPTVEGFDFTVKDPVFEAYLDNLLIGSNPAEGSGRAEGSLILGSNSKLRIGQLPNYGYGSVGIGGNAVAPADATGLIDTVRGDVEIHVWTISVGCNGSLGPSSANGTFTMGSDNIVTSYMLDIGIGPNASGTMNLTCGLLAVDRVNMGAGGTFNFTGGRLAVDTFNTYNGVGTLYQQGGILTPGFSRTETSLPGTTTINGNYNLTSDGTLEIELFEPSIITLNQDQVLVNGTVNLNADNGNGGVLDLVLHFAPEVGDEFVIIDNDETDPIQGSFTGLPEGSYFTKNYIEQIFTFQISYLGQTGNDVVLRMTGIQTNEPPVADAGDDQTVECACQTPEGTKVTLDGIGSYDPDDDTLTYTWTGPFAESPASGLNPSVTLLPSCLGEYEITLVVNDGYVDSVPDTVQITVEDTTPPDVACEVEPGVLGRRNNQMVHVGVFIVASDMCTEPSNLHSLVQATSSQPDDTKNGKKKYIGDVDGRDGYIAPVDVTYAFEQTDGGFFGIIGLRAEYQGNEDRIYTITATIIDLSDNWATTSCEVIVPARPKKGGPK